MGLGVDHLCGPRGRTDEFDIEAPLGGETLDWAPAAICSPPDGTTTTLSARRNGDGRLTRSKSAPNDQNDSRVLGTHSGLLRVRLLALHTMRIIPILAVLLVGIAGLSAGAVATTPSAGDSTSSGQASKHVGSVDVSNASADRLVLEVSDATFTVEEVTVDRVETDRGTVENVSLEEAEVTVDNATIIVEDISTEDRDVEHVFVTIVEGTVTVEEATATANGAEFTVDGLSASVENTSTTTGDFDGARGMQVDVDEFKQLLEGSSVEGLSVEGVSGDAWIELASAHNLQVDGQTGHALFGDVVLESFEDASVSAESARIEDGTLVLEDAEVTVESAEAAVDIGVVSLDEDHHVFDNVDAELEDSITITRDELRIPLW